MIVRGSEKYLCVSVRVCRLQIIEKPSVEFFLNLLIQFLFLTFTTPHGICMATSVRFMLFKHRFIFNFLSCLNFFYVCVHYRYLPYFHTVGMATLNFPIAYPYSLRQETGKQKAWANFKPT